MTDAHQATRKHRHRNQHGYVMVVILSLTGLILAAAATLFFYVRTRTSVTQERWHSEEGLRAAESAVGLKLTELMHFDNGSITGTFADGTRYAVSVRLHPQGDLFRVTAAARLPGQDRAVIREYIVERRIAAASSNFLGAIMAKQAISISGSSVVDGNNYDIDRNPVGLGFGPTSAHDQVAITSMGAVTVGGGARVSGGGDTDRNRGSPGVDDDYSVLDRKQNLFPFRIHAQTVNDHFPSTPDQVLSSPDGTIKARAVQKGTYFSSLAGFNAWAASLPDHTVPPNSVLYLDFKAPSPGMDLGSNLIWGRSYHTVVQHHSITHEVVKPRQGIPGSPGQAYVDANRDGDPDASLHEEVTGHPVWDGYGYVKTEPDGDSIIKALHGQFTGTLICDNLANMNAGAEIFGGVASLQLDDSTSQDFCNGGAKVFYSAQAIDRAIAVNLFTGTSYGLLSSRAFPKTRDADWAAQATGSPSVSGPYEDEPDPNATTRTTDGWLEPRNAT